MRIDGVIVVEGKSDVAFLSNFIDTEFVTTNGSEISKDTIEYLKKISGADRADAQQERHPPHKPRQSRRLYAGKASERMHRRRCAPRDGRLSGTGLLPGI